MEQKDLHEMNNEELWQLFPIILTEHNQEWKTIYEKEKELLIKTIGRENIVHIHHIGSTAVDGLLAKPTIDILIEIKKETPLKALISSMKKAGYIYTPQPNNPAPHMMYMKGYTPEGFKGQAFHVHVRYPGDWNELYFRNYLIDNPQIAQEYGQLKLGLKDKYKHNRDGYTQAKTDFIQRITQLARDNYTSIEKGTLYNIDELEKLYDDLNDYLEATVNYPGWIKGIYPVRETAVEAIKEDSLYVIKKKNQIAGSIILNHTPEAAYDQAKWGIDVDYSCILVVRTLVVHPDFLKQGIASQLMSFAKEYALTHHIKAIRLDVSINNTAAIRLYEKQGYKYIDTVDLGLNYPHLKWFKLYELIL